MKVLFDIIYSTQPDKCSSASKFKKLASRLLAEREDLFIYWPLPEWLEPDSKEWLPKDPRIHYFTFPSGKDRVREYQVFYRELEDMLAFNGKLWDFDICVTMRTQQAPNMRVIMSSTRNFNMPWMKALFVMEEMAVFTFRKSVPVAHEVQDLLTAAGFLAADRSYVTVPHVRDGAIRTARHWFSPSRVMELQDKLKVVNPAIVDDLEAKKPEFRFKRGSEPFCLGFVDRMSNSMTRLPLIYSMMENHWILKGDKGFKVIFSTVSTGVKLPPPEFATVEHNTRDKFWARLKQDMHLIISMSVDAEFSLSIVEAIKFGTPAVLVNADWTHSVVGAEYPFLVRSELDAYATVKMFHDDYEAMYDKFIKWRDEVWAKRFLPGGIYELNLYDDLVQSIALWEKTAHVNLTTNHPNKADNSVVSEIMKLVEGRTEIVLFDVIRELDGKGILRGLADKLDEDDRYGRSLSFSTNWNEFRLALQVFHGWKDASPKVGHLRR